MFKKIINVIAVFAITAVFMLNQSPSAEAASYKNTLQGKIIILDAGHGKGNSNVYEGYDEQVAMLKLALKIKPLLESYGAEVYMTRPDKNDVSVYVRTALVNKLALQTLKNSPQKNKNDIAEIDRLLDIIQLIIDNPDKYAPIYYNAPFDDTYKRVIHPDMKKIFEYENDPEIRDRFLLVSLHSNATEEPIDTSVNGATAFYISNNYYESTNYYNNYSNVQSSKRFAESILNSISKISKIGFKNLGAKECCYIMIREHNIPSVLVENGFHTNPTDRSKLLDDAFLDKLAAVYAETTVNYFSELAPLASVSSFDSVSTPEIKPEEIKPEIKPLLKPETRYLSKAFAVYKEPSFTSEKLTEFLPQDVIIRAVTDTGWGLIDTYMGKCWVYIEDTEKTDTVK